MTHKHCQHFQACAKNHVLAMELMLAGQDVHLVGSREEDHPHQDNNENDAAVNNTCATTAPPIGDLPGSCPKEPPQCSLSPLSEATGAMIEDRSPLTDCQASLQPPSVRPDSGGGGLYGLRHRGKLRAAQGSDFEYSELLLQELDESGEQAAGCAHEIELPEYERQRQERVAANMEKLHALGLQNGLFEAGRKKMKKASKRKSLAPAQDASELRRSSRSRTALLGPRNAGTGRPFGPSIHIH